MLTSARHVRSKMLINSRGQCPKPQNPKSYLFLAVNALLAPGERDLPELLVHHLVGDLGGVHRQQPVPLLLGLAADLLKVVVVLDLQSSPS